MLSDEIKAAKIRAWDAGDAAVAAELATKLPDPKIELSADVGDRVGVFASWAESKSARACPAKPRTVALFIIQQAGLGVPAQQIVSILAAIEQHHDRFSISNPVRTAIVRGALETVLRVDPPRAWPREDRASWAMLPVDIRETITRRESERDKWLRKTMNNEAAKRKSSNGADNTKAVENKEEKVLSI